MKMCIGVAHVDAEVTPFCECSRAVLCTYALAGCELCILCAGNLRAVDSLSTHAYMARLGGTQLRYNQGLRATVSHHNQYAVRFM